MKTFCFTVDDNIRFLEELTCGNYDRLLDHPYLAMYAGFHERYGVKVQLNLFYESDTFDLLMVTERYRLEWEQNASWLKLSFHSKCENENPYQNADYREVFEDCERVHCEICRFAGERTLAETTTVHYCRTTRDGLRALKDHGYVGVLGLFGTDDVPATSYSVPFSCGESLRKGETVVFDDVNIAAIDVILNLVPLRQIPDALNPYLKRDFVRLMIHEQYFYPDYHAYQRDFAQKLETVFSLMEQNHFESVFFEEQI